MNITLENALARLPIAPMEGTIHKHIQPLTKMLPDKRMGRVIEVIILGIPGRYAETQKRRGKAGQQPGGFINCWPINISRPELCMRDYIK
jgi:hypothetical protein